MSNILLAKSFTAEGAIPANSLVKMGSADGKVAVCTAATDKSIGVSTDIPAADTERCDVILHGLADCLYGGAVTRGDLITSDASGRGVTAAPAAGVNNRIVGEAILSGVAGDVGQVILSQASTQG